MAYMQSIAATYALHTQRALNELQTMPRAWREVFDMSDCALRLTPTEARDLEEELRSVIDRYRRDTPEEAAKAPEGARRVSLITQLLPELDEPAASPADSDQGEPADGKTA